MYECISSFHDSEALTVVILSEQELVIQLKWGGGCYTYNTCISFYLFIIFYINLCNGSQLCAGLWKGAFWGISGNFSKREFRGLEVGTLFLWAFYVPVFRFIILFIFINQLLTFQNTRLLKFTPSLQCQKYEYRNVL